MSCSVTPEWNTLLSVQAGAAATLTGLIFVAVSLNLSRILSLAGLTGRAAEAMLQLLGVFFICTLILVPGQRSNAAAVAVLSVAIFLWVAQVFIQIRYLRSRSGYPWYWFLVRFIMSQLAAVPFCLAGIGLVRGICDAVYWLVPGFLFSFAAALVSAWVLLVEILR